MAFTPNASESERRRLHHQPHRQHVRDPDRSIHPGRQWSKRPLDYQTISTSATIPAGSASVDVVIRPINDSSPEIDEPVYLMLSGWTEAPYIVGKPDAATVIIADND